MSLDVYLFGEKETVECVCYCGHEHTKETNECLYSANYTHNCGPMADLAGVYKCVWRPEENGISKASQLIEPLKAGIAKMKADPKPFEALNPENGWGSYETFVPWLERYLAACEEYPEAEVSVSR